MQAQPQPLATPTFSTRAAEMPRSSIRRIFNAVQAVKATGASVIPLHIGDPDFDLPERVQQAVTRAMAEGHTHYSPMPGIPPLRDAIAAHMTKRLGLPLQKTDPAGEPDELDRNRIVCSQGATQALSANLHMTCDSGDSILFPAAYFPNYIQQTTLAGVTPRLYPMTPEFQPRLDELEALIDGTTRAILINTPSNPTGALFPPETIRGIYEIARRHNLWIVSDEAYFDYVFAGEYLSPVKLDWEYPVAERRVLGVFSFSKSFAATGMRMGYTICPRPEVAEQLALLNEPLTGSLTTPVQFGMIAALADDDTEVRRKSLHERSIKAAQVLNENGFHVEPVKGGMFYFLDISVTGMDGDQFADALLAEERVAVVPGSGFGLEETGGDPRFVPNDLARRCIRLCFGLPEELLLEGVHRIAAFIARHRAG